MVDYLYKKKLKKKEKEYQSIFLILAQAFITNRFSKFYMVRCMKMIKIIIRVKWGLDERY